MSFSRIFMKNTSQLKKALKTYYELKHFVWSKRKKISASTYEEVKTILLDLKSAHDDSDKDRADMLRKVAIQEVRKKIKKSLWDYFKEYVVEFGSLFLILALINQVWFQMYEIPSGSMRPTLLEKDRLLASKTTFGINFPFRKGHLHLDPDKLHRGNIVIVKNDNLPKSENKDRYLFIFPAQKQFVKRLIGKPGDLLYFYGGKIYGLDQQGNEIEDFHTSSAFHSLEHIPFSSFEGKVVADAKTNNRQIHSPVYLYQMNHLVGKLYQNNAGSLQGKFYNGTQWVDESPNLSFKDLWGIRNFAMVRMVSYKEALELGGSNLSEKTPYFLELSHSPHMNFPRPHLGMDFEGRVRPRLSLEKAYLPLDQESLSHLKEALSTSRFVIQNEKAGNYNMDKKFKPHDYSPIFKGIPNGTYEFIKGVAYSVSRTGTRKELPKDHPLNSRDPRMIQKLFNFGIQMITLFEPSPQYQDFIPNRYAYYRNGALYVMGEPIYEVNNPILSHFNKEQKEKTHPFKDYGPPLLSNGKLNKELIINYGLRVPKGYYLFLGDNHANSKDCRSWGFIPEKSIQGSLAVLLWPFSSRTGLLNQNQVAWFSGSSQIVIILALTFFTGTLLYNRKQRKRPL
jgi:signal peptidase I